MFSFCGRGKIHFVRTIGNVLRVYSWIFEAILCILAIGVALLGWMSHQAQLNIAWLPWSGRALTAWLLGLGAAGLLCVVLAMAGKLRVLLFLFSLAALALIGRGLFLSPYAFADSGEAKRAMELVAAAVVAVVGAWPSEGRRRFS